MNQFEEQLRQLRPAPLPAGLRQRLEQAVAPTRPLLTLRWPAWATAAAGIVLLAVGLRLFTISPTTPATVASAANSKCPPTLLRVLCSQRDEGLVLVNATTPYRQVRRRYVDLYTWDRCLEGARMNYSVPSEEVVLMPVAVY